MKKVKGFNFAGAKRGARVDSQTTKVAKTIRLDMDIVEWLVRESEQTRIPYQTLINYHLKQAMDADADQKTIIEEIIRERRAGVEKKKLA